MTLTHRPLRSRSTLSRGAGEGVDGRGVNRYSLSPTEGEGWGEGVGRYTIPAARSPAISSFE
jgi:hypothetical protein